MPPNKSSMPQFLNSAARGITESPVDRVLACAKIDFGIICLSEAEKVFCRQLNREILLLCKSMPESTQVDGFSFLMRYAGISFNQEINFFTNYYVPAWSVIYWMIDSCSEGKKLAVADVKHAVRAHTMAMLLHSLDDHLNDGQIAVTHLSLLLRSQAWTRMENALGRLTEGVDEGNEIVTGFINDYYNSICTPSEIGSLDQYCSLFRKQMATWLVVPVLIAQKIAGDHEFTRAIQSAYESFGIAWRLLDDMQDIEKDMNAGAHSSIYYSLSDNLKGLWDQKNKETLNMSNECATAICEFVLEKGVLDRLKARICRELESASAIAAGLQMAGLKSEFDSLLQPLKQTLYA